ALNDGQVTEFGPPAEIITNEVLTRVFNTPVSVIDGPESRLAVYY
ncbi:MAG TPA: iron ABC transporter ATP-binding protein, partial [Citricoccus sp.]|nr:iron ABC transporter ATP-binding protein [Citricoccus sp.]